MLIAANGTEPRQRLCHVRCFGGAVSRRVTHSHCKYDVLTLVCLILIVLGSADVLRFESDFAALAKGTADYHPYAR